MSDVLLIIGAGFQVFALLQIVLSWFNLLTKLSEVFPPNNKKISERTIKRIVYGSSIVYLLIILTLGLVSLAETPIISALFSIILTIAYLIVAYRFRKLFKSIQESTYNQSTKLTKTKAFSLVKTSIRINTICLLFILIFSILFYFTLITIETSVKVGGFNYSLPFINIAFFAGLTMMTYTSYYAYKVNVRILKPNYRVAWFIHNPFKSKKNELVVVSSINNASNLNSSIQI